MKRLPLICLHGGPGATHDYLEPLEDLAQAGRPIILYDQLGNGNSDQPHDPSLWSINLFVEELQTICRTLKLDRFHLLGQSWGGMLAMEFVTGKPPRSPISLVLANSLSNTAQWVEEARRLRAGLPEELRRVLEAREKCATCGDAALYEKAMTFFYRRHLCRTDPWPQCLLRTFRKMAQNSEVYNVLWGSSEFHVTGKLRDWDIRDRLHAIELPTLIMSGHHDEATPAIAQVLHDGIRGSQWVIFEHSSHMPHLEETDRFLEVLDNFLCATESSRP